MAQFGAYTETTTLAKTDIALVLTTNGTRKITGANLAKAVNTLDTIANHISFDESTGDIKLTY